MEIFVAPGVQAPEIEKIPLRHQRDEWATCRDMAEIGKVHFHPADDAGSRTQFLMRALQELVEQPKLIDDLQGRGMNRVAAEVAEEVGVLFQHDDIDTGT